MGRRSRKRVTAPVVMRGERRSPLAEDAARASARERLEPPDEAAQAAGARRRRAAPAEPPDEAAQAAGARRRRAAPAEPPTASARRRRDEAPPPPWGAFPLVELAALAAIVVGVMGFVSGGRTGAVLLTVAAMLGSLAGLEVALREHLGGYRSHTLVLSGVAAIAALAVLFFAGVDRATLLPVAIGVFAGAFAVWRIVFKRRSGGVGFRAR
jgi:hypothetical protein